ncbi:MAG: aspartate-semialdehyde dehydrogenase [Bacteroidales bacterium]|nr:aspartate-semialdehyde dehydrogenase [Candidatus Colimorpha onthohippi]
MKIAVVGATGLVGSKMLQVLAERGFQDHEIIAAASPKSVGREIPFDHRTLEVLSVEDAIAQRPDYALFSAGATVSKEYAPQFAAVGCVVIDNSSAWRMDANVPLVVPEINFHAVKPDHKIIANPNCSTIQMVLALSGLHLRYAIRRIVVSTYQSVTGTGMKAIRQLELEEQMGSSRAGNSGISSPASQMAYPYPIHRNLFPHGGDFLPDAYTTEEHKLVDETRKILGDDSIQVSATVARVPVTGGHSESINVEFNNEYEISEARDIIAHTSGVVLYDDPQELRYPMPIISEGNDSVFVGRIRRDPSQPKTLNLWVVADNLRKGAATNAVQILQQCVARQ